MALRILVTRDFDQMSRVAAEVVASDIRAKQAAGGRYVLGLATGKSPTGLYKPENSGPSRASASRRWRSGAIRKSASLAVSTPQRARLTPAVRQPVSSMLIARASRAQRSRSS